MLRNFTFTRCSKRAAAAVLCGTALVAAPALAQEGQVQTQQSQAQPQTQPQDAIGDQALQSQPGPAIQQPGPGVQQPGPGVQQPLRGQLQPGQQIGQQAQRGPQLGAQIEPHEDGIKVVGVRSESVAQEAGLKEGDIIKRFNNQEVTDIRMLQSQMNQVQLGDEVKLVVLREDEEETLTAKFEQDDRVSVARPALDDPGQDIESLRREMQQLREELNTMKQEHEALKQEHEAMKQEHKELKESKQELKESKQELQEEAQQAQADDNSDSDNDND